MEHDHTERKHSRTVSTELAPYLLVLAERHLALADEPELYAALHREMASDCRQMAEVICADCTPEFAGSVGIDLTKRQLWFLSQAKSMRASHREEDPTLGDSTDDIVPAPEDSVFYPDSDSDSI